MSVIEMPRNNRILPPPTLDATQRLAGFQKSLELRQARAELKKDLKLGKLQLREVIEWDWVKGMKIVDLLRAVPGVGVAKARQIIQMAKINPTNSVGKCSPQQLARVVSVVERKR
jgi:hypothetical protein